MYPNTDQTQTVDTTKCLTFFSHLIQSLLPISSPDKGYRAAVFQLCKICLFKHLNALVLIVKWQIFFENIARFSISEHQVMYI